MRHSVSAFFSRACLLAPLVLFIFASHARAENVVLSSWLVETNDEVMRQLTKRFEVVHRSGTKWEINVPADQTADLQRLVPGSELIDADISATIRTRELLNPAFAGYRTFSQVEALLQGLALTHPEIAKLEQYGTSEAGRPLYALKLSDNVAMDEDEPRLLLTSATHGDEIITTEVLLTLIEELVAGYGVDARLTAMVDNHEIYFVPMLNTDGFVARSRYVGSVDPNRAYPWPENPNRQPTACIKAIMNFFEAKQFVGSIDFHAYSRLIMYPWAYTRDPIDSADVQAMQNLGESMADVNHYEVGPISRIIYVAPGSSADYYYWKTGSLSYGIELTTSKAPRTSTIPSVVTEAREMTWRFVEHF